jgi:selenocysteine lyase/cysteine desulfurase
MQEGTPAAAVVAYLLERRINVKCSAITSTRIDFERSGLPEVVVRASVHYYNTEEEVERVVQAVREAA